MFSNRTLYIELLTEILKHQEDHAGLRELKKADTVPLEYLTQFYVNQFTMTNWMDFFLSRTEIILDACEDEIQANSHLVLPEDVLGAKAWGTANRAEKYPLTTEFHGLFTELSETHFQVKDLFNDFNIYVFAKIGPYQGGTQESEIKSMMHPLRMRRTQSISARLFEQGMQLTISMVKDMFYAAPLIGSQTAASEEGWPFLDDVETAWKIIYKQYRKIIVFSDELLNLGKTKQTGNI